MNANELMETLDNHALAQIAAERDALAFFGKPKASCQRGLLAVVDGVRVTLCALISPVTRIQWRFGDADHATMPLFVWDAAVRRNVPAPALVDPYERVLALTVDESRDLAADLGLDITDWLDAILVPAPGAVLNENGTVDWETFDAMRRGNYL